MTMARSCRATGRSVGEIQVRGPWVLSGYFKGAGGKVVDDDGWFRTGDVAHMDADGFITITDRAKDVIKSGGEWISSIEIENLAVGHPAVLEAAVIATRHPRWQERPLLLVHRKQGVEVTKEEYAGVPVGQDREVVAARRCGVRRGAAAHRDRQGAEDAAARAVRRLAGTRVTSLRGAQRRGNLHRGGRAPT